MAICGRLTSNLYFKNVVGFFLIWVKETFYLFAFAVKVSHEWRTKKGWSLTGFTTFEYEDTYAYE